MESELKIDNTGTKKWYKNGVLHRINEPAIICSNGDKYWYKNGKRHREKGPAIICPNGEKYWYINNQLHRENGPAVIYHNGEKQWYIKGKFIKILYEGKEYQSDYDPCKLCLVKSMCKQTCELKNILLYDH